MKKITGGFLFVSAVLGLSACGDATNTNTAANVNRVNAGNTAVVVNNNTNTNVTTNANVTGNSSSALSDDDKKFMSDAAQGGMAEVNLGKLAAEKGTSAEVKAFGKQMVEDHGKANDELKSIASKKEVTLPADVNSEQKAAYDKISKLSGAEFDKAYVTVMVEAHTKDAAAFKKESENGKDSDVKTFAGKYAPTVEMHLGMIKGIEGKLK